MHDKLSYEKNRVARKMSVQNIALWTIQIETEANTATVNDTSPQPPPQPGRRSRRLKSSTARWTAKQADPRASIRFA